MSESTGYIEDDEYDLVSSMVGRTIERASIVDNAAREWGGSHGTLKITLDDGRTIVIEGWGYDAWGLDVRLEGTNA